MADKTDWQVKALKKIDLNINQNEILHCRLLTLTSLLLSLVITIACNHKKDSIGSVETKSQGYVLKVDEGEMLPDIAAIVKTSPETRSKNLMIVVTTMITGKGLHYHMNADDESMLLKFRV
jgi:hypothetical protein